MPLKCVMLIDDNKIDNFFHERVLRKNNVAEQIIAMESGSDALAYLSDIQNARPDLIFLDINMPGMTGWEFLDHYELLANHLKACMIVVMLSTSENPDDTARARAHNLLSEFKSKPLTSEMVQDILSFLSEKKKFPEITGL